MAEYIGKKYRILIVDDSEINREMLAGILGEDYEIVQASGGKQALDILLKQAYEISLVLLDIVMPEIDGYDVLRYMNRYDIINDLPVIMISAENSADFITKAFDLGAVDYVSRPFEVAVVKRRVRNTIALYAKQRRLSDIIADQIYEKEKNNNLMISILSHIVEFRNGESCSHVININTITELLLRQLVKKTSKYNLASTGIRLISTASALHDIGKIAIPDSILNKPGRLTQQEFEVMKKHSEIGADLIKKLVEYRDEPLMKVSYEICRWHHERYDGKGYPDGLSGDEIPISAQVVSIADVYDALTSERCYKSAYSHEKAIEMICGGECGSFNPLIVECLLDISDNLRDNLKSNSLGLRMKWDSSNLTDEIINNNDLASSAQLLQQYELEHAKFEFFEDDFSDIVFSYQNNPPLLTMSGNAANRLGLDKIITNPSDNEKVKALHNESFDALVSALSRSTEQAPVVKMDGSVFIDGKNIPCEFHCKTVWMPSVTPVYLGIVGKITIK